MSFVVEFENFGGCVNEVNGERVVCGVDMADLFVG